MGGEGEHRNAQGGHRNTQGGTEKRTGGDGETHNFDVRTLTHTRTERCSYRVGAHLKSEQETP